MVAGAALGSLVTYEYLEDEQIRLAKIHPHDQRPSLSHYDSFAR